MKLAEAFAHQAALALENARLFEETERRRREAEELAQILRSLTESLEVEAVARRIVDGVRRLLKVVDASAFRLQPDGSLVAVALSLLDERRKVGSVLPPGTGVAGQAVARGEPVHCADILNDEGIRKTDYHQPLETFGIRSVLATPIRSKGRIIGALAVGDRIGRVYTEADISLLQTFADQAALALENASLFEETRQRRREAEDLANLARTITASLDLSVVGKRVAESVHQLSGAVSATVWRKREDGSLLLVGMSGISQEIFSPGFCMPAGHGVAGRVVMEGKPIYTPDLLNDPNIVVIERIRRIPDRGRAVLAMPLHAKGELVGVLAIANSLGYVFSEAERTLLQAYADQAALAIENARLFADATRRQAEAEGLARVGRHISQSLDPQEVQQQIADSVRVLFDAQISILFRLDPDSGALVPLTCSGDLGDVDRNHVLPAGVGVPHLAVLERRPVVSPDILKDRRPPVVDPEIKANYLRASFRSALCVPLIVKDQVVGVLAIGDKKGRVFTEEEQRLAQGFADQAALAMENARLYEETRLRLQETSTLLTVSQATGSSLDSTEVLRLLARETCRCLGADMTGAYLADPDGSVLTPVAGYHVPKHLVQAFSEQPIPMRDHRFIIEGWETRGPVFTADSLSDPRIDQAWARNFPHRSLLFIPMMIRKEKTGGIFAVWWEQAPQLTPEVIRLVEGISRQAAIAVENARLYADATRRQAEAEALLDIGQAVGSSLKLKQVLKVIAQRTAQALSAERCALQLLQGEELVPVMGQFADGHADPALWARFKAMRTYKVEESPAQAQAIRTRRPVALEDTTTSPLIPISWIETFGISSALVVPLVHQDQVIGTLLAERTGGPSPWPQAQMDLAMAVANQVALAVENARMFEETRRRAQEQSVLSAIATAVSQSLNLEEILQIAADKLVELTGRERAAIRLKDPVTGELRLVAQRGLPEQYVEGARSGKIPVAPGILRAFETGETVILNSTETAEQWRSTEALKGHSIEAFIVVPMKAGGEVVGVFSSSTPGPVPYTPREVELLEAIANVIGVAIEKARLFDELKALTQELGVKNRELDAFVYTVTHDLKAPLVTLKGMTELLLERCGCKLDEEGRHYLDRVRANAQQMEQLVVDLLALSRIGREGRPAEVVSLREVVDQVLLEWGERIRAKGISVTCHELPTLWGLRTQIEQVMANLIGNAVKYIGEPAQPVIEIGAKDAAGAAEGDEMVECYVGDNGIGIDPAYHGKIFEIFQRLKEAEAEGTGVGLAIVKKIVEGAGGRIWVESARGQGATFRFTWPKAGGGAQLPEMRRNGAHA